MILRAKKWAVNSRLIKCSICPLFHCLQWQIVWDDWVTDLDVACDCEEPVNCEARHRAGPLMGGGRLSILRNANVASPCRLEIPLSNLRNGHVTIILVLSRH